MASKSVTLVKLLAGQLALAASLLSAHSASAQMVDLGDFTAPATLSYQNSFTGQQTSFTDWYGFSVPATSFNGISASISFAQLFGVQLNSELYHGSINGNQLNVGSFINSGTSSQTAFGNAVQTTSVIQPTWLTGGDYLIKVSGSVIGSLGGSYAGIANMAPVPLPPTLPLVAVGLALLGLLKAGRKRC
jgi:hypothetical protein